MIIFAGREKVKVTNTVGVSGGEVDVNITNNPVPVSGIGGDFDVTIQNSSLNTNVLNTVGVSGSVDIGNTPLDVNSTIQNTVDVNSTIQNTVGVSASTNLPVEVQNNLNTNVLNTVGVSGSVDIGNTPLDVNILGTLPVSGSLDANITNTIDISASTNLPVEVQNTTLSVSGSTIINGTDTDGDAQSIGVIDASQDVLKTGDDISRELLYNIIKELKMLNYNISLMTDTNLKYSDIETEMVEILR